MLILTRRIGETIQLNLADFVDSDMTVGELFSHGSIEIALLGIKGHQARIGIQASAILNIARTELIHGQVADVV